jgi:hypothetical protein
MTADAKGPSACGDGLGFFDNLEAEPISDAGLRHTKLRADSVDSSLQASKSDA